MSGWDRPGAGGDRPHERGDGVPEPPRRTAHWSDAERAAFKEQYQRALYGADYPREQAPVPTVDDIRQRRRDPEGKSDFDRAREQEAKNLEGTRGRETADKNAERVGRLEERLEGKDQRIEKLEDFNDRLRDSNDRLRDENAELRRQLAEAKDKAREVREPEDNDQSSELDIQTERHARRAAARRAQAEDTTPRVRSGERVLRDRRIRRGRRGRHPLPVFGRAGAHRRWYDTGCGRLPLRQEEVGGQVR